MKEIYAVINDNYGDVKDRVELLFENKEKAEQYAEKEKEHSKRNNYDVITLYLVG